eukprot:710786-Hanusia_phi.AAC.5
MQYTGSAGPSWEESDSSLRSSLSQGFGVVSMAMSLARTSSLTLSLLLSDYELSGTSEAGMR